MQMFLDAIANSKSRSTLFHFTDVRNLSSIRANGLLAWAELQRRGIVPIAPGGNDWSHDADAFKGIDEYVHLSLFDQHPMQYVAEQDGRIGECASIKVSRDVLQWDGVYFSDDVANKKGIDIRPLAEIDAYLDHEVVYRWTDWKDVGIQERLQAMRKFEIMVPKAIAPDFLLIANG